jgi:hypothetical protein
MLTDGTKTGVRILGFLHDALVFGETAGISFEFVDAPSVHCMSYWFYGFYGWKDSEMRKWLNRDFFKLLPDDLRPLVETTRKWTSNARLQYQNDTSGVTKTVDKLWLLSLSEIYGKLSAKDGVLMPAVYNAEGGQYQLYADQHVTKNDCEFCGKGESWLLRSRDVRYDDGFYRIGSGGDLLHCDARANDGVSPGFCF